MPRGTEYDQQSETPRKLAVMGGAYGNLSALDACLADSAEMGAEIRAFLGDSIGCCGHSNEVVDKIRRGFDLSSPAIMSSRRLQVRRVAAAVIAHLTMKRSVAKRLRLPSRR